MKLFIHNNWVTPIQDYDAININIENVVYKIDYYCMDAEAEHIVIEHSLRCVSNPLALVEVAMKKLHHCGTLTIADIDTKRLTYDYSGYGSINQSEFNELMFGTQKQQHRSTITARDVIDCIEKSSYKLTITKQSFVGYEFTITAQRS
jgi:hypothetical protein